MQTTTFCTIQPQSSDRSPFHEAYPVKGKGTVRILTVPKSTTSGTLCLPVTPITVAALATHLCTFFSMLGVFHDMCGVLCVARCVFHMVCSMCCIAYCVLHAVCCVLCGVHSVNASFCLCSLTHGVCCRTIRGKTLTATLTTKILTAIMHGVVETHVCGQRIFGMQCKPPHGLHFGSFWPICWQANNMQKRQFEAILTPKWHGTASCRHAEKAQVCVPVFVEGWQRGQSHNQGPKDDCK